MKLEPVAEEKMELKKDSLQSNPAVTLATTITANECVFDPKKYSKDNASISLDSKMLCKQL